MTERNRFQSSPNTINTARARRRRRVTAFITAPLVPLVVACGHNSVISTEISSDDLATTLEGGCPVDDRFSLSQVTLEKVGEMEAPAPVGERQIQLHAPNLYNAKTPGATHSIPVQGGVDSRTGVAIDTGPKYDLAGKIVEANTEAGNKICVLDATMNTYTPPQATT